MSIRPWIGFVFAVAACSEGKILSPELGRDPASGGAAGAPQGHQSPSPTPAADFAPASLRKLTVEQYRNSVADLLGSGIEVPSDLEPDTAQNGFYAIGASRATISPAAAEKFQNAAYDVAAQALTPERRTKLVPCQPAAVSDATCSRAFVQKLGRRAFRRPLSDAELSRYGALADDAAKALNDFYAGLEFALAGLLQSPNFLFRAELGEPAAASSSKLRYTPYELASRLSFVLWNSAPDEALLDAAASGKLDPTGLAAQGDRLLADARAASAQNSFHAERLGLFDLATLDKAPSVIASFDDNLRAALREDVLRSFADAANGGKDVLAVLDGRIAFVNAASAPLYGVTQKSQAMQRVELPADGPRQGLFGKPALLALGAHASETSPTLRGKYIRERILCESIGAPPPNVVPVLGEPDPNAPTMRDRLRAHATDASCAGCHDMMDPLGLALEHFDAVGRYRDKDQGHTLDTSGNLDGRSFDGAAELGKLLRDDPRSAECLVRHAYRYALGHVESADEESQITALVGEFERSGHALPALFRAVVASDAFQYAGPAKEDP
jgi:PAS domain-containing protein